MTTEETRRDHEAAREVVELSRAIDVPVENMTGTLFREHGGSFSNGRWSAIHAIAIGEYDRRIATPPGHYVRESTIRTDGRGKVDHVFHKTRAIDAKAATLDALLEKAAKAEPLEPVPAPTLDHSADDYMNAFICGDMHMGLYCAARVSGEQWGRAEALRMGQTAIDTLVHRMDPARVGLFVDTGDWLHASGPRGTTVKGTPVDTDGLFHEALIDGYRLKEYMIQSVLRRHEVVHVRSSRGNHGGSGEIAIDAMIAARFADDPRVDVGVPREAMINPRYVSTLEFGSTLLAFAHGDKAKIRDVISLVSADDRHAWGRTEYRYAIGGHLHHFASDSVPGGQWEVYPNLPPMDEWHASMPWRSVRSMHANRYHIKYGKSGHREVKAAELRAIMDAHQPVAEAA